MIDSPDLVEVAPQLWEIGRIKLPPPPSENWAMKIGWISQPCICRLCWNLTQWFGVQRTWNCENPFLVKSKFAGSTRNSNHNNSAVDCMISLKFGTVWSHDSWYTKNVQGQRVKITVMSHISSKMLQVRNGWFDWLQTGENQPSAERNIYSRWIGHIDWK